MTTLTSNLMRYFILILILILIEPVALNFTPET